ncbi:receptor-transporting protein 3-like [Pangasianodon hypophthalmus]|uniref:receptor-transporting protein 3-like n=1 Tax=Pangasianodon hypophthalmus TaxID=310915 RepID=UPI000EFFF70C|nr:receptor-transporting protein 3-like [Pangasianodon hypophthalmus]
MEDQKWMSTFRTRAVDLQDEWTLHMDDSIKPKNAGPGFFEYLRGSFAEFRCSGCGRSWPSKRVQVVFHFSRDVTSGRGIVKVRRCKQECRRCSVPQKEKPKFSQENIDVMVEKLIEKIKLKCYGEQVGESARPLYVMGEVNGPHESAHCEACQLGICQQATLTTQLPQLSVSATIVPTGRVVH